jgi:membrane dipeptidase
MKPLISILCLTLFCITSCKKGEATMTEDQLIAKAKVIHERVITLDTHCDIDVENFTDSINYTQDIDSQVTLPKMLKGGLDVAWFVVYTGQDSLTTDGYAKAYENAMAKFNAIHRLVNDYAPDQLELATTSEDVRRIQKAGKKVAMIGIENAYPVGLDISNVEAFYDLGARYMSLAHNGHNQFSDSHTGEKDGIWLNNGLSDLGKEVIKEMNRLGIMIDVSHPSKVAIREMLALTRAPIIASHSAARALSDESRNLDDEQLEWIRQNGGVVQTVALDAFVATKKNKVRDNQLAPIRNRIAATMGLRWYEWEELDTLDKEVREKFYKHRKKIAALADQEADDIPDFAPQVDVSDFVDHIDYMVERIGLDHVGISSDFDGGGGIRGWKDASETFNVTLELVKRGYSEEAIEQLWSGNLLRVLDRVQKVAKDIQCGSP